MKTIRQKRQEALVRLEASKWEDSKANRKGTASREEWQERKEASIEKLKKMVK